MTATEQTFVPDLDPTVPAPMINVAEYGFEPVRFDEMRRGAWDIHERVQDMDLNGIYASLNFPSFLPGFAGQSFELNSYASASGTRVREPSGCKS